MTTITRDGHTIGTTAATTEAGIARAIVRAALAAGHRAHVTTRDEYAVRVADGTYQVRGLTGTRREPRGYVVIASRITLV